MCLPGPLHLPHICASFLFLGTLCPLVHSQDLVSVKLQLISSLNLLQNSSILWVYCLELLKEKHSIKLIHSRGTCKLHAANPLVDIFIVKRKLLDIAEMSSLGAGQIAKVSSIPFSIQNTLLGKWINQVLFLLHQIFIIYRKDAFLLIKVTVYVWSVSSLPEAQPFKVIYQWTNLKIIISFSLTLPSRSLTGMESLQPNRNDWYLNKNTY